QHALPADCTIPIYTYISGEQGEPIGPSEFDERLTRTPFGLNHRLAGNNVNDADCAAICLPRSSLEGQDSGVTAKSERCGPVGEPIPGRRFRTIRINSGLIRDIHQKHTTVALRKAGNLHRAAYGNVTYDLV